MEFVRYHCGDDPSWRSGYSRCRGDDEHQCESERRYRNGHTSGDTPGAGGDYGDSGECFDSSWRHAAIRRYRNLQRHQHTESDQHGDVEFVDCGSGHDYPGRIGYRRDYWDFKHHCYGDWLYGYGCPDGHSPGVDVDCGDAAKCFDLRSDLTALCGHWNLH